MGWSIGYDDHHQRDIGYGVPAYCDHPDCDEVIDRGHGYVCGADLYGGVDGCGLFFCGKHQMDLNQRCERCCSNKESFKPKADHPEWMQWKLTDDSWERWRCLNPKAVQAIREALKEFNDE